MSTIIPITAEVEAVTPEMAAAWLESNTRNRKVSPMYVAALARDMAAGRWHLSGEAIKLAPDGTLLDGQHRLHAVLRAGVPVQMVVVRGVAHEAQSSIDTGRKRTVSDMLAIEGRQHATTLAAAARILMVYPFASPTIRNSSCTSAEVLDFVEGHPGLSDSAAFGASIAALPGRARWTPSSIIAACHYLAATVSRDEYEAFIRCVNTGIGIAPGSPELVLLRFNQSASSSRQRAVAPGMHYVAVAQTFNACLSRTSRAIVRYKEGESMPLIAGVAEVPSW